MMDYMGCDILEVDMLYVMIWYVTIIDIVPFVVRT